MLKPLVLLILSMTGPNGVALEHVAFENRADCEAAQAVFLDALGNLKDPAAPARDQIRGFAVCAERNVDPDNLRPHDDLLALLKSLRLPAN